MRGRFEVKVDQKGRFVLPNTLRELSTESTWVLTNSQYKGRRCLDLYKLSDWKKLESRIQQLNSLKSDVQAFYRFYISGATEISIDGQRRLLIPPAFKSFATLEREIVLVGMGDKLEIWSKKTWDDLYGELSDQFEDILASVSSMENL